MHYILIIYEQMLPMKDSSLEFDPNGIFFAAAAAVFKGKFLHLNYDECSHFIWREKRAYFDRQPDDWHDAEKELNVKEDEI